MINHVRMNKVLIAKVFKSGNSHALQLPHALKPRASVLHLTRTETGFEARVPPSKASQARRLKLLRTLCGSCPDFPDHTT